LQEITGNQENKMIENIIIKKNPKIEFQLLDDGFKLIDGLSEQNTGFYLYHDIKNIELNMAWFPGLAKWLRIITWILNGVPYFPDAESYKKANIIIHLSNTTLSMWLTDPYMAGKAKRLVELLNEKTKHQNSYSKQG